MTHYFTVADNPMIPYITQAAPFHVNMLSSNSYKGNIKQSKSTVLFYCLFSPEKNFIFCSKRFYQALLQRSGPIGGRTWHNSAAFDP